MLYQSSKFIEWNNCFTSMLYLFWGLILDSSKSDPVTWMCINRDQALHAWPETKCFSECTHSLCGLQCKREPSEWCPHADLMLHEAPRCAVSTDVLASAVLISGMVPASGGQDGAWGMWVCIWIRNHLAQVSFLFPGKVALNRKKKKGGGFLREMAHVQLLRSTQNFVQLGAFWSAALSYTITLNLFPQQICLLVP